MRKRRRAWARSTTASLAARAIAAVSTRVAASPTDNPADPGKANIAFVPLSRANVSNRLEWRNHIAKLERTTAGRQGR
jgi:hypothetical protein